MKFISITFLFIVNLALGASSSSSSINNLLLPKPTFIATQRTLESSSLLSSSSVAFLGIPRGGGLFDKKNANTPSTTSTDTPTTEEKSVMYSAMNKEEVEEWLSHIPVFAVTDSNGAGVVLRPDNDTSVFYFFMSPMMANATLQTLKGSNTDMDLRISAFSLGKIWFRLLNSTTADLEVKLRAPGVDGEEETTKGVEYRLVPDSRDLMGARMLLTMDPESGEKLKAGGTITAEDAQAAIQKALTESPKFKSNFNEIPVFMIAQMRMVKQQPTKGITNTGEEDASTAATTTSSTSSPSDTTHLLPMYFSLQNMVGTWQQFTAQMEEAKGMEPAINLMELHELVDKMQEDSEIDFRNVILIPPVPMASAGSESTTTVDGDEDPMSQAMGGDTLGDL